MSRERFTTILFDLDGTLVDTRSDIERCINLALEEMGETLLSPQQARKAIGPGREEFLQTILGDKAASRGDLFLRIFRREYTIHCLDTTSPFPGIPDLLETLSDRTLIVATNKPAVTARQILEGLNLLSHMDLMISAEEVALPKPHPDILLLALEKARVLAEETLFVGDTAHDLLAGRAASVPFCAALYGYGRTEDLLALQPRFTVQSPIEIYSLIPDISVEKVRSCV